MTQKMVRLNSDDASLLATLAQYREVPASKKFELINELSRKNRPVGMVLAGLNKRKPSLWVQKLADRLIAWADSNRKEYQTMKRKREA